MDVTSKLDELTGLVSEARSMPMSASCIVNRGEVLALLDEMRELLPEELHHAEAVLEDRDAVVDDGRRQAAQVLEEAYAERERLVGQEEVVAEAHRQARAIVAEAEELAARMRRETDDYVDAKLANFEVVLTKTLAAVSRGRDKLRGRSDLADIAERGRDAARPGEAGEAYDERRPGERPYAEEPYAEQPYPEQPYDEQPYDEQGGAARTDVPEGPYAEQPYDEQPYDESAGDEQPRPGDDEGGQRRLGYGPPRW
ncbi:ATP synthase subunit B family protein [Motilibacter deserti]|uniref:hypothetical protein n=1 Tax=Motilibacter deserti TaxID=2714956 RepID=UPI0018C88E9E|nr:hypothetical protein [Motilibacter deserti]